MKNKIILTFALILVLSLGLLAFTACDLFGAAGVGIESIEKTNTDGLVDTYTITLTNGETSTFTVTNGKDGEDGKNANGTSSDPTAATPNSYFRFNLLEDDTYEIFSRYLDMPSRVVIPASYNGKAVTRIADTAFYYDFEADDYETWPFCPIDEIVLPNTIKSIGSYAFYNQHYLSAINFPDSVTEIGAGAFYGCENLKTNEYKGGQYIGSETRPYLIMVDADDDLTELSIHAQAKTLSLHHSYDRKITKVDYEGTLVDWLTVEGKSNVLRQDTAALYIQGEKLSGEIVIPEGVKSISDYAFINCSEITSVTLPASVKEIGYEAFYGCSNLESINIPAGVTSIESYTFYNCSNLTSITLPASVKELGYRAFYGCSKLESVNIPAGVTSIGEYAFQGCESLTSIEIPEGVENLYYYTFEGCSSLASLTLPKSLKQIDYRALAETALTEITYNGTLADWDKVYVNNQYKSFTVHCTDGDTNYNSNY